ncbi:hypothetical protein ACFQHO_04420 [Actinomadura yumaensis]|uniref:hypothetical protein n=1 Tax=Actinomadura yumaensis TaxID=111807 RepID=UPI00360810C0
MKSQRSPARQSASIRSRSASRRATSARHSAGRSRAASTTRPAKLSCDQLRRSRRLSHVATAAGPPSVPAPATSSGRTASASSVRHSLSATRSRR